MNNRDFETLAPYDSQDPEHDNMSRCWADGVETALQKVAQFTSGYKADDNSENWSSTYEWYKHMFLFDFACGCNYGYEMEQDHCDLWKAVLKVEAGKADLKRAEANLEKARQKVIKAESEADKAIAHRESTTPDGLGFPTVRRDVSIRRRLRTKEDEDLSPDWTI